MVSSSCNRLVVPAHRIFAEFSTSNCLMLAHGKSSVDKLEKATLYIPESGSILKSVTTKSIADIAAKTFGWNVEVAPIPFADVKVGRLLLLISLA